MAAIATEKLVNIVINDVELQVPDGELIVESVKRLGLEIPIFCYHARMKPVGMCRMCLVEIGFKQPDGSVRKMPKPQAGCTLPASEGMVVFTDTELVHKDRKGVLEFLLINHPLDCPICDRGGECPLQNNTLFYGPSTSRFVELKRHLPKAFPLSQYVTLDLERCIQCGRCVRFTEEISGDSQLAFRFRGAEMQPSTFKLTDFDSKFSGNVIEICPVGALTSAKYRFRARPWDLETKPAICTLCSNGCNIWFDHRAGKFVRVNGRVNEQVNEEWTCDKGKFGHDYYNSPDRLTMPLRREGEAFVECSWAEAYDEILAHFGSDKKVAALVQPVCSNEDLYLCGRLFGEVFESPNLDCPGTGPSFATSPIASLESKQSLLVFGGSVADDLPIIYLRVRKAWFKHGCKVVVASDGPTDADSFADCVLRYRPGSAATLAAGLAALAGKGGPSPEEVDAATGVPAADLKAAAALISGSSAIVTSDVLYTEADGGEIINGLQTFASATGAEFNCYPREANALGAELIGIAPGPKGMNAKAIEEACEKGKLDALWLVGNPACSEVALENVPFLVVQALEKSEAMGYASIVLPMEAPAEQDGTYTSCEGRVQRMRPVVTAPGDAKPAWRVFAELMLRANPSTPYFNTREIMEDIAKTVPAFAGATYENLEGEGVLVQASANQKAKG